MTLHTVNKTHDCLAHCLSLVNDDDAVLLIEDGVYAAMNTTENTTLWQGMNCAITRYALASDLAARGISDKMLPGFEVINWQQFVALTTQHAKVVSWG